MQPADCTVINDETNQNEQNNTDLQHAMALISLHYRGRWVGAILDQALHSTKETLEGIHPNLACRAPQLQLIRQVFHHVHHHGECSRGQVLLPHFPGSVQNPPKLQQALLSTYNWCENKIQKVCKPIANIIDVYLNHIFQA